MVEAVVLLVLAPFGLVVIIGLLAYRDFTVTCQASKNWREKWEHADASRAETLLRASSEVMVENVLVRPADTCADVRIDQMLRALDVADDNSTRTATESPPNMTESLPRRQDS